MWNFNLKLNNKSTQKYKKRKINPPDRVNWSTSIGTGVTVCTRRDNLIPGIVAACRWDVESGKLVYSTKFGHVPTCVT